MLQQLQGQMAAYGGQLNRFDDGGKMLTNFLKAMGFATKSDFEKWAFERKIDKEDADAFLKELEKGNTSIKDLIYKKGNERWKDEIAGYNQALGDAISRGYDFGAYSPSESNNLTFDFTHGGWGSEDYAAWNGSQDKAWKEAVEKKLVKEDMTSEQIGKVLQ